MHQLTHDVLWKIHIKDIDFNDDFHFPKPVLTLKGLRTYIHMLLVKMKVIDITQLVYKDFCVG